MDLYLFNPDNDMALANGSSFYQPPQSIIDMTNDLCELPLWYKNEGDTLLDSSLHLGPDDHLRPWGWNHALLKQAEGLGIPNLPTTDEITAWRNLSHRTTSSHILKELTDEIPECIGLSEAVNDIDTLRKFVADHPETILKAPWSGSGRGLQTIIGSLSYPMERWAQRIIRTQQYVMCEPLYDKVCDFAMEFLASADKKVHFTGFSLFRTNGYHVYTGNVLADDTDILNYLTQYVHKDIVESVSHKLEQILSETLHDSNYQHYIGVDMMICKINDKYYLHPCVEMNLRMNMGMLTHIIYERQVSTNSGGFFNVDYYRSSTALNTYHQHMLETFPIKRDEAGLITEGYLSLTSVKKDTHYQAMILVTPKENDLMNYFKKGTI